MLKILRIYFNFIRIFLIELSNQNRKKRIKTNYFKLIRLIMLNCNPNEA